MLLAFSLPSLMVVFFIFFFGSNFCKFLLQIGLTFVQVCESIRNFRYALATFCVVASNFGPGLDNAEQLFWEWGHHYYKRTEWITA